MWGVPLTHHAGVDGGFGAWFGGVGPPRVSVLPVMKNRPLDYIFVL